MIYVKVLVAERCRAILRGVSKSMQSIHMPCQHREKESEKTIIVQREKSYIITMRRERCPKVQQTKVHV